METAQNDYDQLLCLGRDPLAFAPPSALLLEERDAHGEARAVAHSVPGLRVYNAGEKRGAGNMSCVGASFL